MTDASGPAAHPQRGDGMKPLIQELETLLNGYSEENESNTPDFILAKFMLSCLENFNVATRCRDRWYGVHLEPGNKYFVRQVAP